jgi:hypothetical protein
MELFDSTKRRLYDVLKDVNTGKIQLPDFQRGWIWDDFRIKGLLASIAKSFPIGAIMLLENGNESVNFKTRPVESVDAGSDFKKPEELILDGQQRITSLYQTIISNNIVKTKNEKGQEIHRWYYIDMQKALDINTDVEEAIISLNEKKQITRDFGREIVLYLSKPEYEYQNLMYPVCMIDEDDNWRMNYEEHWDYDREKIIFFNKFKNNIINSFNNYQLPIIRLLKENSKEAVCQVFEKVNTGGVSLNVFELLTAIFASDNFDLRENWSKIKSEFNLSPVLKNTGNSDFLQSLSLVSTYYKRKNAVNEGVTEDKLPAISAKRKEILNLKLNDYQIYFEKIKNGYIKAAKLLNQYYIFKADDLPYNSQLVPLSAVYAILGDEADNISIKKKIMQWYWCGVFGELYGGANETRYALDFPQLIAWINNEISINDVKTIYDASFNPSRLHTLRTRNSAAYKGIYALFMNEQAKDWIDGSTIGFTNYFAESIDIHHIFPKNWCLKAENNIPSNDFDCIINKTPLSARTNRIIGGDAPSSYLPRLENRLETDKNGLSELLKTHLINAEAIYSDDFYAFFEDRKKNILKLISIAMNKEIDKTITEQEIESIPNFEMDEIDIDDINLEFNQEILKN